MDFSEQEVRKLHLRPGDLLVCEGGEVGRTAAWTGEVETCLYQNHLHRLRAKSSDVVPQFYAYWMRAAYQVFGAYTGQASRTAIPNLAARRLRKFKVPLAPLPEQRRIVAKIESVFERTREAKRLNHSAAEDAEQLVDATLAQAFEDAEEWGCRALKELAVIEASLVDPTDPEYASLPHIGGDVLKPVTGRLTEYKTAEEDEITSGNFLFEPGAVLYSKIRPYLRKAVIVDFTGLCSADIYPLRVQDADLLPEFLRWSLVSHRFTDYANRRSQRARIPKINRSQLFGYDLPLPDPTEQEAIVRYLDDTREKAEELARAQVSARDSLETLEQSVLDRAFRGDL